MKAMNKVASHINEMQKLHEEYGTVFDQLISEQTSDKKEVTHILDQVFLIQHNKILTFYYNVNTVYLISGSWPLDGGPSAAFDCSVDEPSRLFGQEQKGCWISSFW